LNTKPLLLIQEMHCRFPCVNGFCAFCCSDGAQNHGYVPSSVYKTRTQYRTQRYPTFSLRGHQPCSLSDGGSLSKNVNPACSSEVGGHCDEHCTYPITTSHLSKTISSSDDGLQLSAGVAIVPCTTSGYVEVSSSGSRSHFIDDQSQYVSSSHSYAAASQFVSESCNYGTSQRSSSDFYSTSSHYSMRSRLTLPAAAAAGCSQHVPNTPSTITTLSSHSRTAVQQKQNVIQVSKPFESSDVLRYSEKLRRQRLNDSAVVPAEFL